MNIYGIIKKTRDERGQVLVEFALIFTLLVVLLFGIAEFGRGWFYANALSNGARAGARYASTRPKAATVLSVQTYTFGQLTSAGLSFHSMSCIVSGYRKSNDAPFAITDTFANVTTGDAVMVSVAYSMGAVTGTIVPFLGETKSITRRATMRYEGN